MSNDNVAETWVSIGELREQIRNLERFVYWVANVVHTTYHGETGGWRECKKPVCREARKVLNL